MKRFTNGIIKYPAGLAISKFQIHTYEGGIKEYFLDQRHHRLDGPAIEDPENVNSSWWVYGEHVNCSSQEEFEKSVEYKTWKLKAFS